MFRREPQPSSAGFVLVGPAGAVTAAGLNSGRPLVGRRGVRAHAGGGTGTGCSRGAGSRARCGGSGWSGAAVAGPGAAAAARSPMVRGGGQAAGGARGPDRPG